MQPTDRQIGRPFGEVSIRHLDQPQMLGLGGLN